MKTAKTPGRARKEKAEVAADQTALACMAHVRPLLQQAAMEAARVTEKINRVYAMLDGLTVGNDGSLKEWRQP